MFESFKEIQENSFHLKYEQIKKKLWTNYNTERDKKKKGKLIWKIPKDQVRNFGTSFEKFLDSIKSRLK